MNNSEFDSYLKSEYEHIAEAHFRTIDTITAFFRYYLLIMSIPISLIAAFITVGQQNSSTFSMTGWYTPVLVAIFIIISFAGFGVLLYLVNLRMDALLYARTVNALRKHFYDKSPMELDVKISKRELPQTASQPSYLEWRYFGPVVSAIAIFNTFYLFGAAGLITALNVDNVSWLIVLAYSLPISVVFLSAHFIAYWCYARHREHAYLRSYILGVDICGVLNEHRPRFCEVLRDTTGKRIDPEDITVVPVHEHPSLGITRKDEIKVFNEPEYWAKMSPTSSSNERLRSMRNAFKLKVILFTHRPWPNTAEMGQEEEKQTLNKWKKAASEYYRRLVENGQISEVKLLKHPLYWLRMKFAITPIEWVTRSWLECHRFEFDRLVIEKASDDVAEPQVHLVNRFYISRREKIRFFVEDILEKAIKLAYICDVVFLFDHPYNRNPEGKELPSNIVRVKSWEEIYKEIRRLS